MKCPQCNREAVLRTAAEVFGVGTKIKGHFWTCPRHPLHDYTVGCHPGTYKPLGELANKETRGWRARAHASFDGLWQNGHMTRTEAYTWMKRSMGLAEAKAHIACMDVKQCKDLIQRSERHRFDLEVRRPKSNLDDIAIQKTFKLQEERGYPPDED